MCTQERGHTLDIVLSYCLPVLNIEIWDAVFSDRTPVVFHVALACKAVKSGAAARRCRIINPSTAAQFLAICNDNCVVPESVCNAEELSSWFHSTCKTVLDTVAPLKTRQPKPKSDAWLSGRTRAASGSAAELNASGERTNCRFLS